jgi:hypothetical protein
MIIGNRFLVFILTFLLGCISKPNTDKPLLELDITQNSEVKFSEIFSNISYLPLKSHKKGVYDLIDKLIVTSDRIYMFDYYNNKSLYIFGLDGNFINQLSRSGNGPSEYIEVNDFNINEMKGLIEILETRNAIIQYDLSGNFVNRVKLPNKAYKFQYLDGNRYLFYSPEMGGVGNENCTFWEYNAKNNGIVCSPSEMEKSIFFFAERNIFSSHKNELLFSKTFHNTIYQYEDYQMKPIYQLNFGERGYQNTDLDFIKKGNTGAMLNLLNNEQKAFNTPGLFISSRWLITSYNEGGTGYVFFDKINKAVYNGTVLLNDIDYGLSEIRIMGVFDDKVVTLIPATVFLQEFKEMNDKQKMKFNKIADDVNESSPPILQFLQLKN